MKRSLLAALLLPLLLPLTALSQAAPAQTPPRTQVLLTAPGFRGLGSPGVISIYGDRSGALLFSKGQLRTWSPTAGARLLRTFHRLETPEAVAADGRTIVIPKLGRVNGKGPGEGRFYGAYTTWSEAGGQVEIAPSNTLPFQMGFTWEFQLSEDGSRVLAQDGDQRSYVFARGSGNPRFRQVFTHDPEAEEGKQPGRLIGLSPDGATVLAEDGRRFRAASNWMGPLQEVAGGLQEHIEQFDELRVVGTRDLASVIGVKVSSPSAPPPGAGQEAYEAWHRKNRFRLIRWDAGKTGLRDLGSVGNGPWDQPVFCTPDGAVIAGRFGTALAGSALTPFVWTEAGGLRPLADIIRSQPFREKAQGWKLRTLSWLSSDGEVLAGEGINPAGKPEAWVLVLPRRWHGEKRVVNQPESSPAPAGSPDPTGWAPDPGPEGKKRYTVTLPSPRMRLEFRFDRAGDYKLLDVLRGRSGTREALRSWRVVEPTSGIAPRQALTYLYWHAVYHKQDPTLMPVSHVERFTAEQEQLVRRFGLPKESVTEALTGLIKPRELTDTEWYRAALELALARPTAGVAEASSREVAEIIRVLDVGADASEEIGKVYKGHIELAQKSGDAVLESLLRRHAEIVQEQVRSLDLVKSPDSKLSFFPAGKRLSLGLDVAVRFLDFLSALAAKQAVDEDMALRLDSVLDYSRKNGIALEPAFERAARDTIRSARSSDAAVRAAIAEIALEWFWSEGKDAALKGLAGFMTEKLARRFPAAAARTVPFASGVVSTFAGLGYAASAADVLFNTSGLYAAVRTAEFSARASQQFGVVREGADLRLARREPPEGSLDVWANAVALDVLAMKGYHAAWMEGLAGGRGASFASDWLARLTGGETTSVRIQGHSDEAQTLLKNVEEWFVPRSVEWLLSHGAAPAGDPPGVQRSLAGAWRGTWTGTDRHVFSFVLRLEERDGMLEGVFDWTLRKAPLESRLSERVGDTGKEYVRGRRDPATGSYRLEGYRLEHRDLLGLDTYNLQLSPDGGTLSGKTKGSGNDWRCVIQGQRFGGTPSSPREQRER